MTITQLERSTYMIPALDGCFGFRGADGYDYVVNGWSGGTTTVKKFYKSVNLGRTWEAQTDFTFPAHTMATAIVDGIAYIVGGDVFSPTNSLDYIRSSHKFESGSWSQIAADCGIADRCLAQLVYHDGAFYLFGGQRTTDPADGVYHTVMKSVDDCASFTVVNSDTRTSGIKGGLHWGAWVSFGGKIWRICGGIYNSSGILREYDTSIYSTTDGVTFTYESEFPGIGRNYLQAFVHADRLWVIGGLNSGYGANLDDMWSAELSGGELVWRSEGNSSFTGRHAMTCWSTPQGILLFGGTDDSVTKGDGWWLYERVATPAVSPAEGTYGSTQSVTITCATSGASIYYTTDGSEPTSSDTLYSGAISVSSTTTIRAVAIKDGMRDSVISLDTFFIGSETGILDGISNIWLAASTRRLLTSYSGNLIKVRRSSDDTTADIGASGLELDTAALAAHVGANNGFIDTCYDQSGNGRNLTNATAAKQPWCVVSGSNVSGYNNSVAMRNGAAEGRTLKQAATLPDAFTIAFWAKFATIQQATQVLFDAGGGGVVAIHHKGSNDNSEDRLRGLVYVGGDQYAYADKGHIEIDRWYHIALTYDGLNVEKLYIDGELVETNSATGNVTASQAAIEWLGLSGLTTLDCRGDAQDLVILSAVADQATIRTIAKR